MDVCLKVNTQMEKDSSSIAPMDLTAKNTGLTTNCFTNRFTCTICAKQFKQNYLLNRHMLIHSDSRPFRCDECGQGFRQRPTLLQHKAIHNPKRRFACRDCHMTFTRHTSLISHRPIHGTVKRFSCPVCAKGFHQKGNLRNHLNTHTGLRPYKCGICAIGFNQQSNLTNHVKNKHPELAQKYPCPKCGIKFLKRVDLRRHERTHRKGGESGPVMVVEDQQLSQTEQITDLKIEILDIEVKKPKAVKEAPFSINSIIKECNRVGTLKKEMKSEEYVRQTINSALKPKIENNSNVMKLEVFPLKQNEPTSSPTRYFLPIGTTFYKGETVIKPIVPAKSDAVNITKDVKVEYFPNLIKIKPPCPQKSTPIISTYSIPQLGVDKENTFINKFEQTAKLVPAKGEPINIIEDIKVDNLPAVIQAEECPPKSPTIYSISSVSSVSSSGEEENTVICKFEQTKEICDEFETNTADTNLDSNSNITLGSYLSTFETIEPFSSPSSISSCSTRFVTDEEFDFNSEQENSAMNSEQKEETNPLGDLELLENELNCLNFPQTEVKWENVSQLEDHTFAVMPDTFEITPIQPPNVEIIQEMNSSAHEYFPINQNFAYQPNQLYESLPMEFCSYHLPLMPELPFHIDPAEMHYSWPQTNQYQHQPLFEFKPEFDYEPTAISPIFDEIREDFNNMDIEDDFDEELSSVVSDTENTDVSNDENGAMEVDFIAWMDIISSQIPYEFLEEHIKEIY